MIISANECFTQYHFASLDLCLNVKDRQESPFEFMIKDNRIGDVFNSALGNGEITC